MIIRGAGGSPALDGTLDAVADALEIRDDLRSEELWVLGTPRAKDWGRVVGWDGLVRALVVPYGFYVEDLIARADQAMCFGADSSWLAGEIPIHLPVPSVDHDPPPAPPPPGTLVGAALHRRRDEGRPPESVGVSWVLSEGSAAVAEAVVGWGAGRAVVLLSSGEPPPPLDTGVAVIARSALEIDEATSFFEDSPALARALAREGARMAASMPDATEVARAVVLRARGSSL